MGELTLACSPSRGTDGLCAFGRSAGLPGRRASRPGLGRARGSAHRAGPQDHLRLARGQSFVRLVERDLSDAIATAGDGNPGLNVVSWAGRVHGAGSREDSPEFGGLRKVGSIDPDGPARTSLPALESGWHGRSTRIPSAQPGKGSSGKSRLASAKQAEAPARVMRSEVTRLRRDSQEQDSDWLRIAEPTAGPLRPGLESVARLFTSLFPVKACASSASRAAQHFRSSEVIAARPSLLVFVGV